MCQRHRLAFRRRARRSTSILSHARGRRLPTATIDARVIRQPAADARERVFVEQSRIASPELLRECRARRRRRYAAASGRTAIHSPQHFHRSAEVGSPASAAIKIPDRATARRGSFGRKDGGVRRRDCPGAVRIEAGSVLPSPAGAVRGRSFREASARNAPCPQPQGRGHAGRAGLPCALQAMALRT